jgi:PST family polysaccharide transporter
MVWSVLEAAVSAVLSLVTSLLIARIVGPGELGIGAAAVAAHVLLWVVVNALFADALVQRPAIDDRVVASAFWASVAVGSAAMLVQLGAGWGLAVTLNDRRLLPMAVLLALPLPLVGGGGVMQGLLTRDRAYRRLALRTLIGQGLGTAVGVLAAVHGAGAWALVSQQAVTSACGALVLLSSARLPMWRMDRATLGPLLRTGVPLTASTLVLIARYRLFAILIGGFAGAGVLGQVHLAFRLVDTVRELAFTALWRLMLPAMSEHQHDRPMLLAQVDRWLRLIACGILPLCGMLALGVTQVVALLMGPNWADAGQAALPLVALMAVSALMFPSGVALVAAGQARFALYGNLASMALGCGAVAWLRPADSWHAMVIWSVSQVVVMPYSLWVNARALGVDLLRPLSGGLSRSTVA